MFIFTRYLYEKQEVELSLRVSLLEKKIEESLFWAYELFYSGFQEELFLLFIFIYYDHYATLNPSFGIYIIIKYNEFFIEKKEEFEDRHVCMIIHDFITRPFNLDVFSCRMFEKTDDTETNYTLTLEDIVSSNNYFLISYWVKENELEKCLEKIELFFENKLEKKIPKNIKKHIDLIKKYKLDFVVSFKTVVIFIIIHLLSLTSNLKMGKNLYVVASSEEVEKYKTICFKPCYKTLSKVSLFNINNSNYLYLFDLKRDKKDIVDAYWNNWLYHASFSPLWIQRIQKYGGIVNENEKKIDFEDIDLEEAFYEEFNLEPDEQPKEIQEKSIQKIELNVNYTWDTFYEKFGKNGLIKNYL